MRENLLEMPDAGTAGLKVLKGYSGLRNWPAEVKGQIVETLRPGAKVAEVARRHVCCHMGVKW